MDPIKIVAYLVSALSYGIILTILFSSNVVNNLVVAVWVIMALVADIGQFLFDIFDNK